MPLHYAGTECVGISSDSVAFLHGVFAKGEIRRSEGTSIPLKFCSFLAIPDREAGSASSAGSPLPRIFFQFHNCSFAVHYLRNFCKDKFTKI